MGVTLFAIMKHNLSAEQILDMPERMKSWDKVLAYNQYYHDNEAPLIFRAPRWDYDEVLPIQAQDIEKEWEARKTHTNVPRFCDLNAGYADFKFNRKTVMVSPFPHHKYGNLFHYDTRNYILGLMRLIGHEFNTDKILYCPDSACSTAVLEEKAREGWSLEELEAYGRATFGRIPEKLTEAAYNFFFIDDYTLDLEEYNGDRFLFNRANEEYFLELKFGQGFIIFRR